MGPEDLPLRPTLIARLMCWLLGHYPGGAWYLPAPRPFRCGRCGRVIDGR